MKYLPKKAYSLNDAVQYLTLNYDINISVLDLLEHFQNGDLQLSLYIDGWINGINSINRKEVNKKECLSFDNEKIFLSFDKELTRAKFKHDVDEGIIKITLNNIYFDITVYLKDEYYIYDDLISSEVIKIYNGDINRFSNFIVKGFMPLDHNFIEHENIKGLLNRKYLDEMPRIFVEDDDFTLSISMEENRTKLYLDDIKITHQDMILFLERFNIVDSNYAKANEINKLKSEIEEKNKLLSELNSQVKKSELTAFQSEKEVSGKSLTSFLNIIHALKDVCLSDSKFETQEELINHLSSFYVGYTGLSENNLRKQFSAANRLK